MASNMQYANLLLAMVLFADFPLLLPLRGCVCFFQTVNKQATPTSIHIVVGPRTLRRGTAWYSLGAKISEQRKFPNVDWALLLILKFSWLMK